VDQFPQIRVEGPALQRGRQYGEQARDRVRRSVDAYREIFAHWAGWDWPKVRAEAARFRAPIAACQPSYPDEIRGIADGGGLDPADALAINVRTEVMFAARAGQAAAQPTGASG
jgi:isopenicillin-N N-acyltransferase like protein